MTHQLAEAEIETEQHRDIRGAQRERDLNAKQAAKYYGYRGVKPGWVNQLYYNFPIRPKKYKWPCLATDDPMISCPEQMEVAIWTKRDMWNDREMDIWPLDRRHSRGRRIREPRLYPKYSRLQVRGMRNRNRLVEFACEDPKLSGLACDAVDEYAQENGDDEPDNSSYDSDELANPPTRDTMPLEELLLDTSVVSCPSFNPDTNRVPLLQHDECQQWAEDDGFILVSEKDFDVESIASST